MSHAWTAGRRATVLATGMAAALALAACGGGDGGATGGGSQPVIGLITKTDTNPFFVKMKEGAQQAANTAGVELQSYAGKMDGDNESQVQAIETLISRGAKGLLITPAGGFDGHPPALQVPPPLAHALPPRRRDGEPEGAANRLMPMGLAQPLEQP